VSPVPDEFSLFRMALAARHLRMLVTAAAAAVLTLAAATAVFAAPAPLRRDGPACDSQANVATLRKLLRQQKSYGGPLAEHTYTKRLRLRIDLTAHVHRPKRTLSGSDAAVIQNDGAAAGIDTDGQCPPALQWFGILASSVDSHPRTRSFSPRSPRGPPAAS
jgi:hypothetical protein